MNIHRAYFAINPQVTTTRAHGLDISKYDLYFSPDTATAPLDFVIQRIGYRLTRDEYFDKLIDGVMQVPIRGGYWYLNSDVSWRLQADKYLSCISGWDYHFHACDFEAAYNILGLDFAYYAWQWIHYVASKTGKPVFLYTSPSLYNEYIYPSQSRFGINWNTVPLWTAQWFFIPNPNGTPTNPKGRTTGWRFWQYTEQGNGPLYGVSRPTACDLDVFNGTRGDLARYLGITVPTEQPTEAESMFSGKTNTLAKLWREPGVGQIDSIQSGTTVTGDAPLGEYVYLRTPRAGYTKKIWLSNYVLVTTEPPPVEEPPVEEPTVTLKHTIKIYSNGSYQIDNGAIVP